MASKPARILHLHSSFSLGGKEARATRLMNLMGPRATHSILSAVPEAMGARDAIDADIAVDYPADAPPLYGKPAPHRYWKLARYMQRFDLVLSYNWGSMDGVMAHRMLSPVMTLPPLIHHEDGFNEDETARRNPKRNAFRRLGLGTADAVVVPSTTLMEIARNEWRAGKRLTLIRNGIVVDDYAGDTRAVPIPGLVRQLGEVVIGTIAGLRAVKNLPRLVRAVADLPPHVKLAIVGEGPERGVIEAAARDCGMTDRLVMPGFMTQPHRWIGHFDMIALSSHSEQQPIAVLEGMAAGLPVASLDVGDVRTMVAPENRPLISGDETGFRVALHDLAYDAGLRTRLGTANQAQSRALFDEPVMVGAYDALYGKAMGGVSLFDLPNLPNAAAHN